MAIFNKESTVKEVDNLQLSTPEIEEPVKDYVPEGFDSVEEYLQDMRDTYAADLEADDDNRKAALEDKKFVAGEQWDPIVLQQRAGLPCLTINTIPQFTAQLVGDWRTNRVAIKVLPAENGDKATADVRADIIRAIEQQSRAPRVYDSAFESMVQCGDGAFKVGVKYASEDVFDQDIVLESIDDALSCVWDRLSIDPTGRDATRVFVDDRIPYKEFKATWKEADPSTLNTKERRAMSAEGWCDDNTVRVTEHWRLIERKKMIAMFKDGSTHAISDDSDEAHKQMEALIEEHGNVIKTRLAPCRYAQMHLVTGFKILAGPYEWKCTRLPVIRMSGRITSVGDRRVRFGLVRDMKDNVRLRNFFRSIAAEQLGYAPKAQWIATEAAVEGREEALRKAHLSRDPLLIVNDEAIIGQNIQRLEPPQIQAALLQEFQVNSQDMKDITGIHDASLGIKSNETSGRAIMARQREGDVASITYYDNGNAAIMEAGDVINQWLGQIYDGTRVVRTIGEDESTKLMTINDKFNPDSPDLTVGKYDIAITTGANYTTRKVEAAESMMEAIQVFPQMMEVAGDLVVKAQDWPGAEELAERLRKVIPPNLLTDKEREEMGPQQQQQGIPPEAMAQIQEQAQKMGEQLQKLEIENATLKAKQETELEKLKIDQFKANTDRMKVIADAASVDIDFIHRELEHEAQLEENAADREHQMNLSAAKSSAQASTQPAE